MVTEDGNLPVGPVVGQHLSGHVVRGIRELVQLLLQREGGVVGTEDLRCEALPIENRKSFIMLIGNFFPGNLHELLQILVEDAGVQSVKQIVLLLLVFFE